jgi:hypothetical protein
MRQAEIVVDVIQRELLAYTHLTLAERGDPPTDGRHMLADVNKVDLLNERRVDLVMRDYLMSVLRHLTFHPLTLPETPFAHVVMPVVPHNP